MVETIPMWLKAYMGITGMALFGVILFLWFIWNIY